MLYVTGIVHQEDGRILRVSQLQLRIFSSTRIGHQLLLFAVFYCVRSPISNLLACQLLFFIR